MRSVFGLSAIIAVAGVIAASGAQAADPAAVVGTLQHTPVSLFTYGLANLHEAVNSFAGLGADPAVSDFDSPFSGPVAESATVTYNSRATAILINLIRIQKIEGEGTPEEVCQQAIAAFHMFAGLDPKTGQLPEGQESSFLGYFFFPDGTDIPAASRDPAAIDRLVTLRYVFALGDKHYECRGPFYGTNYAVTAFNF